MYVHNISKPAPGPSLSGDDKGQLCVLWRRVNFDRSTVKHAPNSFSAGAPAGGAYSAPPDPLAGLREATCKGKGGQKRQPPNANCWIRPVIILLLFCRQMDFFKDLQSTSPVGCKKGQSRACASRWNVYAKCSRTR